MTVLCEGKEYYPLPVFAAKTHRSIAAIRVLMFKGNQIRKLKYIEDPFLKYLIPVEEFTEFPFTTGGRFAQDKIYHYTEEGKYELLPETVRTQLLSTRE